MTEKKNNGPAAAEAPRKKQKDGGLGQYFRKNRSPKIAAEIAAEIEQVLRAEQPAAKTEPRRERSQSAAAGKAKNVPKNVPQRARKTAAEDKPKQSDNKLKQTDTCRADFSGQIGVKCNSRGAHYQIHRRHYYRVLEKL